jgi:hypothetical protein
MAHGCQVNSLQLVRLELFGGLLIVNDQKFLVEYLIELNYRLDLFVFVIVILVVRFLRHREFINKTSGFFVCD